jgi:hypothetical protein
MVTLSPAFALSVSSVPFRRGLICLPQMLIYHSERQPVPDNQEAFLTPVGQFDAKLIFEITEHIKPEGGPDLDAANSEAQESINIAAAKYYLDDLLSVTGDSRRNVNGPKRIDLGVPSMKRYSAYYLEAEIAPQPGPSAQSEGQLHDNMVQPANWLHLLFVRAPVHGSEFVAQMLVRKGELSAEDNSRTAQQVMSKIAETLEFKNLEALISQDEH